MSKTTRKIVRKLLWNIAATLILLVLIIGGASIMHLIVNNTPMWVALLVGTIEFVVIGRFVVIGLEKDREEKERKRELQKKRSIRKRSEELDAYEAFCKEYFKDQK